MGYRYTEQDKADWIREGLEKGANYLLIVCDTFSYEDYPVFATTYNIRKKTAEFSKDMQMIHETINLKAMSERKLISPQELILAARIPECHTCGYKGYVRNEFRVRCKKCGRVLAKT